MLYVGKCKECSFIVSAEDYISFKQEMATHLEKSHKLDIGFTFDIPLKDFDSFSIMRIRNNFVAVNLRVAMMTKSFWRTQRTPFSFV